MAYAEDTTERVIEESDTQASNFEYDFKSFRWGDSQEVVEEKEGDPDRDGDMTAYKAHYIVYETTVAGKDALLAYYFCDDGLFQTRYILTESHSNENLYIDDYSDVRRALSKKYGEPSVDWEDWQDSDKKSYYASKKGDALSYGYLSYLTCYALERTDILMEMSADNYIISTTIDFQSREISAGEADYSDDF